MHVRKYISFNSKLFFAKRKDGLIIKTHPNNEVPKLLNSLIPNGSLNHIIPYIPTKIEDSIPNT